MLVKFAIEPESLDRATVNQIARHWSESGILVDSKVKSLKNEYKELFEKFYKTFRTTGYPLWAETDNIDWANMLTCDDLAQYQDTFSLALIADFHADLLGIPKDGGAFCGDVEAIRSRYPGVSIKFEETDTLSQKAIRPGPDKPPVKDIWQKRFNPLVSQPHANLQITIVDRYIASNIYKGRNELFNLLKFIHSDSPGCVVTVWSSSIDAPNVKYVEERLDREIAQLQLSESGIKRITVFLCHDDAFNLHSGPGHDRYIRFGGFTCEIGGGIEIFRGDNVDIEMGFSLKSPKHLDIYRDREKTFKKRQRKYWRWPRRG